MARSIPASPPTSVAPTIAVIIAVYNGAETLEACLDSLVRQTVPPDQIIVQDGGSTDATHEIIARYRARLSHFDSGRDNGVYDAWNKALAHLRADWVWFLGCDDRLAEEDTIARLKVDLARTSPDIGLVYGIVDNVSAEGLRSERVGRAWTAAKKAIAYRMSVPHTALLSRGDLFKSIGGFDARYRIAGDYEWFSRALAVTGVQFVERLLVLAGDGGLSQHIGTQLKTYREYGEIILSQGRRRPVGWFRGYATTAAKVAIQNTLGHKARLVLVNAYRVLTLRAPRNSRT